MKQQGRNKLFIDEVRVKLTAGAGGNGCISFRREKYVPRGGPDGGDGGNGGSIYFQATTKLHTLIDLKYHAHWIAPKGTHGSGNNRHGKNGKDLIIQVPCGTIIRDWETGEILADLKENEQQFLAVKGGKGGKGNARFVSSTYQTPRFAEKGEKGEEKDFLLELKLIADVGFVGLPNAGKSTLLSSITSARPKIANYPFTTLTPNLGVVSLPGYRTITVADIPGIIEGASEGKGLGHDFLKHIERTRVLLFLIDMGDPEPENTIEILEHELEAYSPVFNEKPKIYVFNKLDITENQNCFIKKIKPKKWEIPVFGISAITGKGVKPLLDTIYQIVENVRNNEKEEPVTTETRYVYEAPFKIYKEPTGFRVEGKRILRVIQMTNFDNEEAVHYLQRVLSHMGLFRALKRAKAKEGDLIYISDYEFTYSGDMISKGTPEYRKHNKNE